MDDFPLRPPCTPMPPALGWVLAGAFGPAEQGMDCPDPSGAFELASQLGLASRVGGRRSRQRLIADLGEEGAEEFRRRYRLTAVGVILEQELCISLGATARRLKSPLVFLKGAALNLSGAVQIGLRESSDIDLLLPHQAAEDFAGVLTADGWTSEDVPLGEQHLPPLLHPDGLAGVEVHWRLNGLQVARGKPANFEDLESLGFLLPLETVPENCFRLSEEVQVAHLVTHALGQHLWFPGSYPQLRFLADLADLDWDEVRWSGFRNDCWQWIEGAVSRPVFEAALELLAGLAGGTEIEALWGGDGPPSRYLRHLYLGFHHPDYARSLRFRSVSRSVRLPGERTRAALGLFRNSIWLTQGQVDQLYGKPRSHLGYLGWRLFRPFDVVHRLIRYGFSWILVRFGRS